MGFSEPFSWKQMLTHLDAVLMGAEGVKEMSVVEKLILTIVIACCKSTKSGNLQILKNPLVKTHRVALIC